MEKKSNSNLFKDMKSMSKTRFSHYLLSYNCLPVQSKELRAKFWRSHLNILYLSTWHNNKGRHEKIQFKQPFATTFRCLTKLFIILVYHSTFPYTWPYLLPMGYVCFNTLFVFN